MLSCANRAVRSWAQWSEGASVVKTAGQTKRYVVLPICFPCLPHSFPMSFPSPLPSPSPLLSSPFTLPSPNTHPPSRFFSRPYSFYSFPHPPLLNALSQLPSICLKTTRKRPRLPSRRRRLLYFFNGHYFLIGAYYFAPDGSAVVPSSSLVSCRNGFAEDNTGRYKILRESAIGWWMNSGMEKDRLASERREHSCLSFLLFIHLPSICANPEAIMLIYLCLLSSRSGFSRNKQVNYR